MTFGVDGSVESIEGPILGAGIVLGSTPVNSTLNKVCMFSFTFQIKV
jgi:hypothetical protein